MVAERIQMRLVLTSDAEPGSGFGSATIDQLLPRDWQGRPVIPASHLKGVLRLTLREVSVPLGLGASLEDLVFGPPTSEDNRDRESLVRVPDLQLATDGAFLRQPLVTRTRVDPVRGTAHANSLRTAERLPVQSVFTGWVTTRFRGDAVPDLAFRLSVRSLRAIGGGRTRGSGLCIASLDGDTRAPGELLRDLVRLCRREEA